MPEMSPTSDEKLQTHVCGTVWNIKKCSCGTSSNEGILFVFLKYLLLLMLKLLLVVEDDENIEIVVDTTGNDTEGDISIVYISEPNNSLLSEEGVRNLESFELQEI